jgi:hypothetical protein
MGDVVNDGGDGSYPMMKDDDAVEWHTSLRALSVELDGAMKHAEEKRKAGDTKGAISQFTHVINCANIIRSIQPANFILGVLDNWVSAAQHPSLVPCII